MSWMETSKAAAWCLNLVCQRVGLLLRGTLTLVWSLPFVSVLYSSSFFGRGGVLLVSLLASQWVLVLVLVSSLDDMGVVVLAALLLVFELSVAMEVSVVLSFGSMDNQALGGLVLELMLGLAFVLDVESVSQLAFWLVL